MTSPMHLCTRRPAAALLLTLLLAACGGGGSDAGAPPPAATSVTATNQTAVTRASFAGVVTGTLGGSLGIADGGQASPLALAGPGLRHALLVGARKRAATVYPGSDNCTVSGSFSGNVDDRDDSLRLSGVLLTVGDSISITFNNCVEEAGVVLSGKMSFTYTQLGSAPVTVAATVAADQLTVHETATGYVAGLSGGFRFTYSEPTASTSVTQMVVPEALAMSASTPRFSDTVTLLDGYTVTSTYDTTAPARTVSTATGPVASTQAGGFVQVATPVPLVQYDTEDYPHAGQMTATGTTGRLTATVLSNTQVRIDLDANGDNTVDATQTLAWTALF